MANEQIYVKLVDSVIDVDSLRNRVDDPDSGAHGWFVGVTRRTTEDRVTDTLFYEAHPRMAQSEMQKLAEEAVQRFSLLHLVLVHRLGEVPVGEASVVVGCSSAHRVDTFAAMVWIMDTLKRDVPIWKRELYSDGTTEWIHPGETGDGEDGDLKDGDLKDGDLKDGDLKDGDPKDGDPKDGDPKDGDPKDGEQWEGAER